MPKSHADTPLAMARVLAMVMAADAQIDDREVQILDELQAFRRLGVSRPEFLRIAQGFSAGLGHHRGEHSYLRMSDIELVDQLLDEVRSPQSRLLVARLAAGVITADGRVSELERMVYDHMLCRWGLDASVVTRAIREDRTHRTAATERALPLPQA